MRFPGLSKITTPRPDLDGDSVIGKRLRDHGRVADADRLKATLASGTAKTKRTRLGTTKQTGPRAAKIGKETSRLGLPGS